MWWPNSTPAESPCAIGGWRGALSPSWDLDARRQSIEAGERDLGGQRLNSARTRLVMRLSSRLAGAPRLCRSGQQARRS